MNARNRAANLRKSIAQEHIMCVEQEAIAVLCRWVRENREALNFKLDDTLPDITQGLLDTGPPEE